MTKEINNIDEEIWIPVHGFEDEYEVSNHGRLMSHVVRGGVDPNKRTIRQIHNKKGDYLRYVLTSRNKKKTVLMHRLVYEHFVGNIPTKYEIHHLDGNKQNNMVDNLECVSRKEHCLLTIAANENVLKGMNNYNKYYCI